MLIFLTLISVLLSGYLLYLADKAEQQKFDICWTEADELWTRI